MCIIFAMFKFVDITRFLQQVNDIFIEPSYIIIIEENNIIIKIHVYEL